MYVSEKVRPVETIRRMKDWRIEENDAGGEFNCNIV
jgi:hypothetical protein